MRELIDKWRKKVSRLKPENSFFPLLKEYMRGYASAQNTNADELEAKLPVWTKITEDEATWPDGQALIYFEGDISLVDGKYMGAQDHLHQWASHWRPLCDIDTPLKEQGE